MIWFSLYVIIAFICSYFCFRYFIKSYNSCNCPKKGDLDKYYKDNSVEEIIIIVGAFWLLILIAFIVFSPFIIIEYISSEREEKANREFQKEIAQREEGYTCSNCTFYKIAKCELHKIAVQPEDEICKDFLLLLKFLRVTSHNMNNSSVSLKISDWQGKTVISHFLTWNLL